MQSAGLRKTLSQGECIGGMQKTQTEWMAEKEREELYVSDTEKNVWREKGGS